MVSREDLDNAVADARWSVATGAATTATSIAMGADPAAATAVGASAPALMLLQKLGARWMERRQDRAARALTQAAKILDVGLDVIGERTESHDARLGLLARVIEAAARTPLDEKVTALGRVLAEGLSDGGSVDDAIVIAAALADIEAAHVFVLHYLATTPLPPDELRRPDYDEEPRGWEATQLA